jgi:hypothetical protein
VRRGAGLGVLDRIAKPFRKGTGSPKPNEDEIISAVIERIPVVGEPVSFEEEEQPKVEDEYVKLVRRLKPQLDAMGVTKEELIRNYDRPLYALLLLRFLEEYKKKPSQAIRDRLVGLGFRLLQNDVWVLPPSLTPQDLKTQADLKAWVRRTLTKSLRRNYQYVMPFIALVDLKLAVAERFRVVKQPQGRTMFSLFEAQDLLPASFIYGYMRQRGFSLEGMIRGGDPVFLASAFGDSETMAGIRKNQYEVIRRLRRVMNVDKLSLSYMATLHENELGGALAGLVPRPLEVATSLNIEARYWERFLDGTGRAIDVGHPGKQERDALVLGEAHSQGT